MEGIRQRRGRAGRALLVVTTVAVLVAGSATAGAVPAERMDPGPGRVTTGIAVYDRATDSFVERFNADVQFRSASVVKLLIALDFFWDRGPDYSVPPADRARLRAMLRSSDNDPASYYWVRRGGSRIVDRMVARLDLTGTAPPPAAYPGYWGYTAITADDTIRIYRYILEDAPAPVRDFIMTNLHSATRCAADGFDQYFGIPSAFERPWAVKQGWSGFSSGGCTAAAEARSPERRPAATAGAGLDLVSEALHTTGTVGSGDRTIVAVYTLHADGTAYGTAYSRLTELVRSLDVPGAERPEGKWLPTWGSGVRVRAGTTTDSPALTTLPAGVDVLVSCQQRGQTVSVPPYSNDWWAYLPQYDGYLTNIYMDVAQSKLPGVPVCGVDS